MMKTFLRGGSPRDTMECKSLTGDVETRVWNSRMARWERETNTGTFVNAMGNLAQFYNNNSAMAKSNLSCLQ